MATFSSLYMAHCSSGCKLTYTDRWTCRSVSPNASSLRTHDPGSSILYANHLQRGSLTESLRRLRPEDSRPFPREGSFFKVLRSREKAAKDTAQFTPRSDYNAAAYRPQDGDNAEYNVQCSASIHYSRLPRAEMDEVQAAYLVGRHLNSLVVFRKSADLVSFPVSG